MKLITQHDDESELTTMQRLVMTCQSSSKVSFEICKNNDHVAHLILQRGTYRLGETVTGVLNFTKCTIPCFQISLFLEHSENVEASFLARAKPGLVKATRRVFAEQHNYVLNTVRTGISLPIPVGSSPEFKTNAVSLSWVLRIEFITGTKRSVPLMRSSAKDTNFVHQSAVERSDVEAFECLIPLRVLPTKTGKKASIRSFEIF
ncbi:Rgp1-domain-containing protein [Zopfochytrium polystomum]|nr:Rgp1-domain-containing protein [Zopfochytrium polystomum]